MGCAASTTAPPHAGAAALGAPPRPLPQQPARPQGVSLAVLLELASRARALRHRAGPEEAKAPRRDGSFRARRAGEALTTADVCNEIIKPATAGRRCAWLELLVAGEAGDVGGAADAGDATDFVSHAWMYDFEELVSALQAAAVGKGTSTPSKKSKDN